MNTATLALPRMRLLSGGMAVLLALLIALVANSLYVNRAADLWPHPDQVIPVEVLQGMHARGDLDTDWAKAELPEYFRACRYNFSGYMLASYAAITVFAPQAFADDQAMALALQSFSRVLSALTLVLVCLLLSRHLGWVYGAAGALAVMVAPQLYQDAHYARPEALSTFCFTVCFALSTLRPAGPRARYAIMAAIAVIAGFMASIKFTHLVAGVFAVPLAYEHWCGLRRDPHDFDSAHRTAGLLALCALLGFAIGAPGALLDWEGYRDGLAALQRQYGGGHPPHGHLEASIAAQLGSIGGYYLATLGLLTLALHAAGYAGKALVPAKYAFGAILLITLGGFALQNVFFERNFALLVPAFIMVAMAGLARVVAALQARLPARRWAAPLAAVAGVALFVASQVQPVSVSRDLSIFFSRKKLEKSWAERAAQEEQARIKAGAESITRLTFGDIHAQTWPNEPGCRLYIIDTYGDDWSARYLGNLPSRFQVVGVLESDFAYAPTSTLHTYHSSWRHMFVDTGACAGRAP